MPQSLSQVNLHITFSTHNRNPLILKELKNEMYAYIATICKSNKSNPIKIGGSTDHIHIVTTLHSTVTISKLLEEIKKTSSKWFKEKDERVRNFSWQCGYAAFSVSQSQLPQLIQYIEQQEQHHKKKSFQDELREFLTANGVEYDERYIWD